jgi:hypothetical protein
MSSLLLCVRLQEPSTQFISLAIAEKPSALQTYDMIAERAERSSRSAFLQAMALVPKGEERGDDLPFRYNTTKANEAAPAERGSHWVFANFPREVTMEYRARIFANRSFGIFVVGMTMSLLGLTVLAKAFA